ncbi:hypothetical protein C1889_07450 [Pseudomonas sp. FW507-12TSA]|nr:hypothetical protein C1889_07450 [Pseudomonas sp. FW507-12TSA]
MRLTRRPAGSPTVQCLRSAIVVNGAFRIKSQSKSKQSESPGIALWSRCPRLRTGAQRALGSSIRRRSCGPCRSLARARQQLQD